jgi:hypothetical protein
VPARPSRLAVPHPRCQSRGQGDNTAAEELGDVEHGGCVVHRLGGEREQEGVEEQGRIRPMAMSRQVRAAITQAGLPRLPPAGLASASTLATMSGSRSGGEAAGTLQRPIQAGRCRLAASEQRRLPSRSGGSGRGSCGPAGGPARPGRCSGTRGPGSQPGPRGAGVLSVKAWITSPRTRGSGSPASSGNLVHTRSSSARTWQVHRFLHASWRARLSSLRDSSSNPSRASSAVRLSPAAGRPLPSRRSC